MPLWRDPLDELIEDLERTLPAQDRSVESGLQPLEDVQMAIHALLHGSELERTQHAAKIQRLAPSIAQACRHGKQPASASDTDNHGDVPLRDPAEPPADD